MRLVPYNQESANNDYQNFYSQNGGMRVFTGQKYQKGYGLGNVLSGLFRSAVPLLKKGAISLGKTALKTGLNVAKDGLEGKSIKASFKDNLKQAGLDVMNNVVDRVARIPNKFSSNNRSQTANQKGLLRNKSKKTKEGVCQSI